MVRSMAKVVSSGQMVISGGCLGAGVLRRGPSGARDTNTIREVRVDTRE